MRESGHARRIAITAAAILAVAACSEMPSTGPQSVAPSLSNGFPDNGKATLFKFNLIGHPGKITNDNTDNNGGRIFVKLQGNTKIMLSAGPFDILDYNGTDGSAAFQLPDPDPDGDGVTLYGMYIRPKGKPNQSAALTSCKLVETDLGTEELCSTETVLAVRTAGKPKVENVSKEMLTVCLDTDGDGVCDLRERLFSDALANYLWNVDNSGLRNVEVRFIEIPQNVGLVP
jgi:hypothetical protein